MLMVVHFRFNLDLPAGCDNWVPSSDDGFSYAADLVRFIRSLYGDFFIIAVAGKLHYTLFSCIILNCDVNDHLSQLNIVSVSRS